MAGGGGPSRKRRRCDGLRRRRAESVSAFACGRRSALLAFDRLKAALSNVEGRESGRISYACREEPMCSPFMSQRSVVSGSLCAEACRPAAPRPDARKNAPPAMDLRGPAPARMARTPVRNQLGNRMIRASVANRCLLRGDN